MTPQSLHSLKHHTHTPSSRRLVWVAVLLFRPLLFFPHTEAETQFWGWGAGAGDDGVHNGRMISERRCWFGSCITDLRACTGSQSMNRTAALGFQRCWISQNKRRKPANIPPALEVTSPNPLYTLKHTCKESDLMSTIFQSRLNQSSGSMKTILLSFAYMLLSARYLKWHHKSSWRLLMQKKK